MALKKEDFKNLEVLIRNYNSRHRSLHWAGEHDNRKVDYSYEHLENFRNNSLGDGMHHSIDEHDAEYIRNHFQLLVEKCGQDFVYNNLDRLNVGNNQNYINYKDRFVSVGDNFHINFLYELNKYVFKGSKKNRVVCEIGGAYGNLSNLIYMNNYADTIILIDLPEQNFISYYYLHNYFPNASFYTYNGSSDNVTSQLISDYDFIIVPPFINFDSDIVVDLFINTRSMMEMNFDIIKQYFLFINKHIAPNGFFYNVNKLRKNTVGHNIDLDNYPYDDKWTVVSSKPSWMQEIKIHGLLTRRDLKGGDGELRLELRKLYFKKYIYLIKWKIQRYPKLVRFLNQLRRLTRTNSKIPKIS